MNHSTEAAAQPKPENLQALLGGWMMVKSFFAHVPTIEVEPWDFDVSTKPTEHLEILFHGWMESQMPEQSDFAERSHLTAHFFSIYNFCRWIEDRTRKDEDYRETLASIVERTIKYLEPQAVDQIKTALS